MNRKPMDGKLIDRKPIYGKSMDRKPIDRNPARKAYGIDDRWKVYA